MTCDEMLDDLRERIDRAVTQLWQLSEGVEHDEIEATRLLSKVDGLLVVKDWLRGYR